MKVISNYEAQIEKRRKLQGGDIVFMRGTGDTNSFYGLVVPTIGIIELKHGSSAYTPTKDTMYVGDVYGYWIVEKVFDNCELLIRDK